MANASQGVTRDQLIWAKDAYIREETYGAAPSAIINAHHALPIASLWGVSAVMGLLSSSARIVDRTRKLASMLL